MKRIKMVMLALTLCVVPLSVWIAPSVRAQSTCPYADIRLDTEQPVDGQAICEAARPWSERGIRIFVFLTDRRPDSEDAWFALLDQVEAEAGLRDPSQPDVFDRNGLAFEASTASDLSWAYSITYGELLYDSPLDTDEAALFRVKNQMRTAIAAGDPTSGFVQALNMAYEISYPDASPVEQTPLSPTAERPVPTGAEESASSPWGTILLIVVAVVVLGVGGYALTIYVIRPAVQRSRRRAALQAHLETLQTRTANLLNACGQLLQGETPQETVLYQLFSAYGGEHYDDIQADVYEWLRRSRGALDDAFDLRKKLIDPAIQEQRTLEQTVQDWEMLYVTFVGNSERILSLNDQELRTLLDPLLTLEREAPDVQLAGQLDDLRRELAGGLPLKVDLQTIDPAQSDAEGILGYIDRVKAQIARLQAARQKAPERLAEAQAQRLAAEEEIPDPFVMTEKQLFAGIDQRLAQAENDLEKEVFLRAIERAAEVERDVETVKALVATLDKHEKHKTAINAITEQGYRPERLPDDLDEVEADLQEIVQHVEAGDYVTAATWIEELGTDSRRALEATQAWQTLHGKNKETLHQVGEELSRVAKYWNDEGAPAWQTLQTYPQGNWSDVAAGLEQAQETLKDLQEERVDRLEQLNSLDVQELTQAEQMLVQAAADLAQAEQQMTGVANRLAEVQAAEAHFQEALRQTAADIDRAATLRDQEDVKIGPQVDRQIEQARELLAEARQRAEAREFLAAIDAQTAAREQATAAYAAASEQVQEINALQAELEALTLDVGEEVQRCQAAAQALPAVARTAEASDLVQQVLAEFSKAQQARAASAGRQDHALSEKLRAAVEAYQQVDRLADQAQQRVEADRAQYDRLLTQTRDAVHEAQAAIQKARWAVDNSDAKGAGRHALQRARQTVEGIGAVENATREALARMRQRAQKAQQDARQAESQAHQQIDRSKAERRRRRRQSSWSGSFGSSGSSSSSSSRRISSSGSSRRSSSRGSLRRSVSRGGSRRK